MKREPGCRVETAESPAGNGWLRGRLGRVQWRLEYRGTIQAVVTAQELEATGGEEEEEDPVEQGGEKAGLENPARKVEGRREREKQARGSLEE